MARGLTSLCVVAMTVATWAQGFGRFGYSDVPQVPGFEVSAEGFKAQTGSADTFRFVRTLTLKRTAASAENATYICETFAGAPQSIRVNLRSPGFEIYCYYGLDLQVRSLGGPVLTSGSASYGPGTPAPGGKWVMATFADVQPPVLFSFLDGQPETVVSGRSGEWHLKTLTPYKGWVRVCLPFGTRSLSASGVQSLGHLAQRVKSFESVWSQPAPKLVSQTAEVGDTSVKVTWSFDRAGALVPPAYVLAKLAGYKLRTPSSLRAMDGHTEQGPLAVCLDKALVVQFPIRRLRPGRPVAVQTGLFPSPPTTTEPSVATFFEGAITNLMAARTKAWSSWGTAAIDEYLARATYTTEPLTGRALPFDAEGVGSDLAAAAACLWRSVAPQPSSSNRLLDALLTRFDPMSWRIDGPDRAVLRRAEALTSLACLLDQVDRQVATSAMLHAGLCAETALESFLVQAGHQSEGKSLSNPLAAMRSALFSPSSKLDSKWAMLFSPIRVASTSTILAQQNKSRIRLTWSNTGKDSRLELSSKLPWSPSESSNAETDDGLTFRPTKGNTGWLIFELPESGAVLPRLEPLPKFQD